MDLLGPILFFIFTHFSDVNPVKTTVLASESISLERRYDDKFVNDVFKGNILLNLHYLAGKVKKKEDINWENIQRPMNYSFTLLPNETFAFHEDVLLKYKDSVVRTTNARFNFDDGFKFSGLLFGDGVCHFASLVYWVAKEAGLEAYAPVNHSFAVIPEIAQEFGVSIYKMPGQEMANAMQNLYITNNKDKAITFKFSYKDNKLQVSIEQFKQKEI